jgi:cobalt-zinc-cadmium efflux system outer membrane protein
MNLRLLTCITLIAALFHHSLIFAADNIVLDHLSLSDAEKLFVSNNRELLAAKRAVEGSEADTLSAAQKPNPTLSFNASNFNLNRKAGNTNPEGGGGGITNQTISSVVAISQLFERGDKREIRMAVANNVLKASQYNFKDTVRQQNLILKVAYYDLLLAQESEQVQLTNAALYDKTLDAAELRLKAGDIASSDVARIRVDALRAKNDLRQAQATHQKAQANLAYIVGKEQEANSIVATDAWPSIDAANTGQAAIDTDKLNDRADIKAAEAMTQAADENRRLAEALKKRDVTIGVQYQHYPGQGPGNGEDTIGAAISIPLFTNYQYQGEIARAEVDYTTALEAREQTRATAIGEITRARADLEASIEKVRRFDQQMLAEAKKAADAAEFAYQHGAMGVTDLLDARRILRALELDAASVRADYAKSLAAWQAATNPEENP